MLHTTAKMMFMDIGNQFNASTGEGKIMANKQVTIEDGEKQLLEVVRSRPSLERAYTQLKAAGATVTRCWEPDYHPGLGEEGESTFLLHGHGDVAPCNRTVQDVLNNVDPSEYGQYWVDSEFGKWVEPTAIEIAQENGIRFYWKNEDTLRACENTRTSRRGVRHEIDHDWAEEILS